MTMKRNALVLALASLGICATPVAHATASRNQSAAQSDQAQATKTGKSTNGKKKKSSRKNATKLNAVEVNGFVSSLENSIALKRNSNEIVEAVSAEQIGKLPGTSIADTLGRMPGLAVQKVDGRPQVLSIHGLGPDFSTALINGSQQVSTSNNRDVQFDQYPSSWFDAVVVHMSPSADLVGQGLAGTVDMHTIRPLEKSKGEAAINAHYIWDGLGQVAQGPGVSDKGYHVNGVWVHQFADHTFGVTLGVDAESNPAQIEHQAPWGYPTAADGNAVIGGDKNYSISDLFKRQGYLATFQWEPTDNFTSTLDLTYDKFNETQQAKGMEFPLAVWGNAQLEPGYNVSNGLITNPTFTHVKPVIRNDYNKTRAKVWNVDWSNAIQFDENWSAKIDANYSRATRRDVNLESYTGSAYGANNGPFDTINATQDSNGMWRLDNSLNYNTSSTYLTDPQGWGAGNDVVQEGFINAPHTDDYLANLRMSVQRDFVDGPISSVEFGVDRGTRNKTYNINQHFLTLGGGFISGGNAVETAPITGGSSCDPLSWMSVGPETCYNPLALIASGEIVKVPTFMSSLSLPPNWKVRERDLTSYVQFNVDTYIGNVGVRGNFGLQVAHTNQTSTGERVAPGSSLTGGHTQLIPVSGGTKYTRWLPSANLVFSVTSNDDFRIGAARTLARPRMDQMNASLAVSGDITHLSSTDPNQAYFSASGGNAKLLPTMADNYNVSYEHYFTGGSGYQCTSADAKNSDLCRGGHATPGYFSVSAYFLSLHDYIDPNAAYPYDFQAFVPSYLTASQQAQLGTTQGIVSGPKNDGHGYVKGAQVTLNLPLAHLTPYLNGFGVILTGNRIKSSLVYGGNPNPIAVPGLSKWVAGGTLYYQRGGFEARVNDSYRSSFLGRVSGISASRIEQTIQGGSSYDAQLSYTFDSGALKGLTVLAQGSNLSNKKFVTYQNNDSRQTQTWEAYGRRYDVGISYKFQ